MNHVKEKLKLLEDDFMSKTKNLYSQINRLLDSKTEMNKKNIDRKIKKINEAIDREFLEYSQKKKILFKN